MGDACQCTSQRQKQRQQQEKQLQNSIRKIKYTIQNQYRLDLYNQNQRKPDEKVEQELAVNQLNQQSESFSFQIQKQQKYTERNQIASLSKKSQIRQMAVASRLKSQEKKTRIQLKSMSESYIRIQVKAQAQNQQLLQNFMLRSRSLIPDMNQKTQEEGLRNFSRLKKRAKQIIKSVPRHQMIV